MLCEISQTQEAKYCMIPIILGPKIVIFIETESKIDYQGLEGWGMRSYCLTNTKVLFGIMKTSGNG